MKRKTSLILIAAAFLLIAAVSAYQLFHILFEYNEGEQTYDDLTQYVDSVTPTPPADDTDTEDEPDDTVWPTVDFHALTAINDDVVGWIQLQDTKVNYPIVKGEDNDYYLNRLYDGTGNGSGSIFMDFRNSSDFSDRHTIIYGHRMNNGTMFANIANYSNREFFDTHPYVLIMTPEKNYKMEVFSAYVADTADDAWDLSFDGDDVYEKWLASIRSHSYFDRDTELTKDSRIVTLSTCTYEFENARFVVHGVLHEAK